MVYYGNVLRRDLTCGFGEPKSGWIAIGTEFAVNEVRGVVFMDGVRRNRLSKSVK
jgi:hypothetical protein